MKLWKTPDDSSILTKMDFKLNHELGKFFDERYCDFDLH